MCEPASRSREPQVASLFLLATAFFSNLKFFIYLFIYVFMYLFIYLFIYLCVYVFMYLFI